MTDAKPETMSRNLLLVLLLVCLVGIGAVIYLVARPGETKQEAIVSVIETKSVAEAKVNVMDVIDAIEDREAAAVEGQRYKVLVIDEAREGASGIARIGGLVTFVPNARKGDVAIIEITRLKRSTADSIVIETLERGRPVAMSSRDNERPREDRPYRREDPASEMVGQIYRGTITDMGKEGDGVTHVGGKVVFVAGASVGEHVEYRITEDIGRFARAEVVAKSDVPYEIPSSRAPREPREPREPSQPRQERASDQLSVDAPVKAGDEYEVEITEDDRRNPGVNGVARINNFVVFVADAKVGERMRIRISQVRPRAANAEVIERLGSDTATP
jgi:predicted RNA-binding protein with TRAM domain